MSMLSATLALALVGSFQDCETAPEFPAPPPETTEPAPDVAYLTARHIEGYEDAFLGVGHLEPQGPDFYYDWHEHVAIPLYRQPAGEHFGWIRNGWVVTASSRTPFTYAGTTETEYERASLIVLEARDDGWLRIRHHRPRDDDDGTAWTHQCGLSLGKLSLRVRLWRDFFLAEDAPPLHFRNRVRHALRTGPSVDRERVAWIGVDGEVEALEIRGEWMRVKIYQPGKFYWLCSGEEPWQGEEQTGWIRWWDREKGPWLYWSTRGC